MYVTHLTPCTMNTLTRLEDAGKYILDGFFPSLVNYIMKLTRGIPWERKSVIIVIRWERQIGV